jgi:hypothetical protein
MTLSGFRSNPRQGHLQASQTVVELPLQILPRPSGTALSAQTTRPSRTVKWDTSVYGKVKLLPPPSLALLAKP